MELNISEKFILLIQHPEKESFLAENPAKSVGFFGAVLMDLAAWEKVAIENDKLLSIKSADNSGLMQPHSIVIDELNNSKKIRKAKYWLNRFSNKYSSSIKMTIKGLEDKGKLKIINKKFLFIKYYRTKLVDYSAREHLINKLRNAVLYSSNIEKETISLLGLVQACNLHKILFKDRSERKIGRQKIKMLIENNQLSGDVSKAIQEMNAAIIAATTGAAAASIASSSS